MKGTFTVLLSLFLLLSGFSVLSKLAAESESSLSQLDQLADESLQLTKFSRYEEAKALLTRFGHLFSERGVRDQVFTMDELRVLTVAYEEALGAVTAINMDHHERVRSVTSFRLAINAVLSTYQPLWADMESSVLSAFQQVKNAALEGDSDAYNRNLNSFLTTYSIIQPSLKIDLSGEKLQKLDSKIIYIDKYRNHFAEQEWASQLDSLENDLKQLFTNANKDEADPSIWWMITMTGSTIILTLSYVSWRKYKGQKEQKKERRKRPNN